MTTSTAPIDAMTERHMQKKAKASAAGQKRKWTPGMIIAFIYLGIMLFITLFPFFWMIRTALTPAAELVADSGQLFPNNPTWINFQRVLGFTTREEAIAAGGTGATIDFIGYTWNTIVFAGSIAVVQTLSAAMAAYAFARLRFKGRDLLFSIVLAGLLVPGILTLLPNFALMRQMGWLNTMHGLVAPSLLMSPFAIFFLRQFFLSLPREVEEAAAIDGVGPFMRFWRITLPMSRGPIATMMLITLVGMWKDFLWPLVAGNADDTRVLTVALQRFLAQSPNVAPDWTGLMAAATIAIIPVFIMLILLGRQLVQSLNFSGGKM
ncbi:MAG: carbohydrate ABC transporter permease [Promicromonosporaceae bacterium]|nr:carbohydrate ABC transporter permease [Promicromonosporaceae bacterium]